MMVLCGEYQLTIDEKNRLLIPAEIRRAIVPERDGEAFFVVVGRNGLPWLYPEVRYQAMLEKYEAELTPSEVQVAYDQMTFAMASRVEWDKQGRFLIPEQTRRRTKLDREITMLGVGNHLELWNRLDWEARVTFLNENRGQIAQDVRKPNL